MPPLAKIEGIGPASSRKLKKAGVRSVQALLKAGATPKGRKEIAAETGFSPRTILEWVNRADLFRVKGVGEEYSDLLEQAGVDTVVELAKRDAAKLHSTLVAVNARKKLVRQLPSAKQVGAWIRHAKRLPRVVSY
jgi:predicted flap endonuclease-1-like 5' DNA nuclease